METIRRAARVSGRVQGVSFRYYAVLEARSVGVSGWVRNEADGSVTLEVQGDQDAVEAMLRWATEGPSHARVDRIVFEPRSLVAGEVEFGVDY